MPVQLLTAKGTSKVTEKLKRSRYLHTHGIQDVGKVTRSKMKALLLYHRNAYTIHDITHSIDQPCTHQLE